jgi:hypothetical protein
LWSHFEDTIQKNSGSRKQAEIILEKEKKWKEKDGERVRYWKGLLVPNFFTLMTAVWTLSNLDCKKFTTTKFLLLLLIKPKQ